ncbi:hypothetical protein EDB85DRAFT_217326 [Lactarius pseudohatsudake]|nr:hypothetical protein EDB85DRAFT_217326 [Lactarius pseudohatsudake]
MGIQRRAVALTCSALSTHAIRSVWSPYRPYPTSMVTHPCSISARPRFPLANRRSSASPRALIAPTRSHTFSARQSCLPSYANWRRARAQPCSKTMPTTRFPVAPRITDRAAVYDDGWAVLHLRNAGRPAGASRFWSETRRTSPTSTRRADACCESDGTSAWCSAADEDVLERMLSRWTSAAAEEPRDHWHSAD